MTINKAIEILTNGGLQSEVVLAERLGVEALKWRALMKRDYGFFLCGPPLPGETEDKDAT